MPAAPKKPGPGRVFTKKVTVEKQGDFTPMKNTGSISKKATPAKPTGNVAGRRTSVTTPTGPTRGRVTEPGAKANEKMKKAPAKPKATSADMARKQNAAKLALKKKATTAKRIGGM